MAGYGLPVLCKLMLPRENQYLLFPICPSNQERLEEAESEMRPEKFGAP